MKGFGKISLTLPFLIPKTLAMKKELFSNVLSLIWNLFVIYVCYSLCRLTFLLENFRLFSENLTLGYALNMFGAGIIFDTTAILYSLNSATL